MKKAPQLGLFQPLAPQQEVSRKPESGLEAVVQSAAITVPIINSLPGYGFLEGSLKSFHGRSSRNFSDNYQAAENLFYGLIDMVLKGVPHEIYEVMNTQDIAAMAIGYSILKRWGRAIIKGYTEIKYHGLTKRQVEDIIPTLVAIGYQYTAVRNMRRKGFTQHSTRRHDLRNRITALPNDIKRKFLISFKKPMARSSRDNSHYYDFIDPNSDGTNNHIGTIIYTTHVIDLMQKLYPANSQPKK